MALKIEIELEDLKNYCRVEHDADDKDLKRFQKMAISELSSFLNNDFKDEEQPPELELWVLNRVATYYENRQNKIPKADFSLVERYRRYPMANDVE